MVKGLVSVIILNWNNKDVIFDCMDSVLRKTHQNREIILVDNGSRDGSLEIIKEKYAGTIRIIENRKNLGFAEGVNIGIRASRGEFIALLNSDAVAEEYWLEEMIKTIDRSEKIGMCACKIYLAGRDRVIDNTGGMICRDGLGMGRGRLAKDEGQFDHLTEALSPSGCAAVYRRKMLEEAGLFDRHFFVYAEDIDVALRGHLLGYRCAFNPHAVVFHRFSSSTNPVSDLKAYYVERNRMWVAIKCFPLSWLMLVPFYTLLRYGFHLYGLFKNRGPAAKYVQNRNFFCFFFLIVKAYLATLWYLPYLMIQRFRIQRQTKISRQAFTSSLRSYSIGPGAVAMDELF